jgi:hypothetical protein
MKNQKVQAYIRQLQEEALAQAAITPSRIALELGEIAFDKNNSNMERMRAVELLQKQFGLQKQVVDANVNGKIITVDIEDDGSN